MAIYRANPKEIVAKLRQVEVLVGHSLSRLYAIRLISFTQQTY